MDELYELENEIETLENEELYPAAEDPVESVDSKCGIVKPIHGLNIRQEPSTCSSVVEVLSKDSLMTIIDTVTDSEGIEWFEVLTQYGVHGYCMKEFVEV